MVCIFQLWQKSGRAEVRLGEDSGPSTACDDPSCRSVRVCDESVHSRGPTLRGASERPSCRQSSIRYRTFGPSSRIEGRPDRDSANSCVQLAHGPSRHPRIVFATPSRSEVLLKGRLHCVENKRASLRQNTCRRAWSIYQDGYLFGLWEYFFARQWRSTATCGEVGRSAELISCA